MNRSSEGSAGRAPSNGGSGDHSAKKKRAIVTIASGNYVARARVLFRSILEHEPDVRRFLVVVDRPVAVEADEPFEAIAVEDLTIPDFEDFMAQYTVMEANTAVKPYAMRHILAHYSIEELVYLDPDILLTGPLTEVWKGLERGNVVLTPHLRDPFRDFEQPTELGILQAGTFNLGFIAVRRGVSADFLLDWWAEKTEHDCVVDWSGGLFVDQKWMDMAPGYVDGVVVLRDAGYNVAYWNLHEREITEDAGKYSAGGRPLAFFHFSGYDPGRPLVLSKHQTRHDLPSMPSLRRLCETYAALLDAEGHARALSVAYGFSALDNGIRISPLIRWAVRYFRKQRMPFPSVADADAFCRFMVTPNAAVCGTDISPLAMYVLDNRPDVVRAYPDARRNAHDEGFSGWLENCAGEVESETLYSRFKSAATRTCCVDRISLLYKDREDLQAAYPDAFRTLEGLEQFGGWLTRYGIAEASLNKDDVKTFLASGRTGFETVVEYYFSRPDLHPLFPLALLPCGEDFVEWLTLHATREGSLTLADVRWFQQRIRDIDPAELALLTALRNDWVRLQFPLAATRFGWRNFCGWLRSETYARHCPLDELPHEPPNRVPILQQLETLHVAGNYAVRFPRALESSEQLRRFADAAVPLASPLRPLRAAERDELEAALSTYGRTRGVNLSGYFHYAAGVGSSVRSMARVLDAAAIPHDDVTLPVPPSAMSHMEGSTDRLPARFWKRHRVDFDVAITVANADAMRPARGYLGSAYEHRRRHIGYWVWETECLPGRYAAAADGLESIWTPSEYSAESIRRTLGDSVPVHVVPHAVVSRMTRTRTSLPVALPNDRTLIGFFFDARSVVERKNPAALLRAFRRAFRRDDKVTLVLKCSHTKSADARVMKELVTLAEGLPVIWMHDLPLDDLQTTELISRLDVYASLHRSEGFGLVLAEAMALGKPVVATGYSGNLEFMSEDTACLVDHRVVVTDRAHGPYPRGTHWAEPDVEHAATLLRSLAHDRELRATIGARAKRRIEQRLSPRVLAHTVRKKLGWTDGPPPASTVGPESGMTDAGSLRLSALSATASAAS